VVILHYKHPELASGCLESLRHQTYPLEQIVLVDNGSADPVEVEIPNLQHRLHRLHLSENRGFAGGVNAGIHWLRDHAEVDAVWLLNNDIRCERTVLDSLVDELIKHPETGAVSSAMEELDENGRTVVITGGRFPLPILVPFVSRPGERVDYLCGACLLLRRAALEQVGLLDDNYFFFFEDVDWCFRARQQGWRLGVSENGLVRHQRSSTIGQLPRLRAAYYRRSYIRFLRQYSKAPAFVAFLTTAYRLLADGLRGRWAAFAGTLDGWREGWRTSSS
jgi:GT2 family glycosyltransferase